jgi:aspartyl/asparaginyl beta-hydroxylase (cupin superfamily)
MLQTLAIVRTLWPHMSTTESVALYRDIHDVSNGRVDFTMFMKVGSRHS